MKRYVIGCCVFVLLFVSCQAHQGLVLYPNPDEVAISSEDHILFEFTPKSEDKNINTVTFYFDDDNKDDKKEMQYTGKPVRIHHKYPKQDDKKDAKDKKLYYRAYVEQDGFRVSEKKIVISHSPLSDDELQYLAIKKIANVLENGIQKVIQEGDKITFSSFKDANFEYVPDQRDMRIIQKIIQALEEVRGEPSESEREKKNYRILERAPQALVRLAHEAAWKLKSGEEQSILPEKQLDYGLRTTYESPKQPFLYSLELSGVDDRRLASDFSKLFNTLLTDKDMLREIIKEGKNKNEKANIFEGISSLMKTLRSSQEQSRSERRLLCAKFDTADFLIVIDRLEDPPVERSKPIYYDPAYDSMMVKRTAKVKINARILDKDGSIRWIKDISGVDSDTVLPQFVPPAQQWSQDSQDKSSPSLLYKYLGEPVIRLFLGIYDRLGNVYSVIFQ